MLTELHSEWTDVEPNHLFFDSLEELSCWNHIRSTWLAGKQQRIQHSKRIGRFYSQTAVNLRRWDEGGTYLIFPKSWPGLTWSLIWLIGGALIRRWCLFEGALFQRFTVYIHVCIFINSLCCTPPYAARQELHVPVVVSCIQIQSLGN